MSKTENESAFDKGGLRLSRFSSFMSQHYRHYLAARLPSVGLTISDYPILLYLWHHIESLPTGTSQTQLSRSTLNDKAAIARSVRKLSGMGYVIVSADPSNRSRNIVSLSSKGKKVAKKIDGWVYEWEEDMMGGIDSKERQDFLAVFNKIFTSRRSDK